jgi:hypothetical protein
MGIMIMILGVFGMAVLAGLVLGLYFKTTIYPLHRWFFPFLIIKLAAGIGLGIVYFWHYQGGDTVAYHHDAVLASGLAFEDFSGYIRLLFGQVGGEIAAAMHYADQPRALMMSKLLSIIYIFSFQSYWIAGMFFSLFSFTGSWLLANYLLIKHNVHKLAVAIAFFLFPSVVFWGAGILKESLMIGSIGLLVYFFLKGVDNKKADPGELLLSILLIGVIWLFKYYYAAILIPVMAGLAIMSMTIREQLLHKDKLKWIVLYGVLVSSIIFITTYLHPNLRLERVMHVLVDNYSMVQAISRPEKTINLNGLTADFHGIAKNLPQAVVAGLFRPFVWEAGYGLSLWIGVENLVVLALTIMALPGIVLLPQRKDYLLLLGALVFILVMAALLAISAPNFGSLSRYRVGFMPFYLLLVLNPVLEYAKKVLGRKALAG